MSKHIDKKYLYQLPSGAAVHPCRLIHKDGTLMWKHALHSSSNNLFLPRSEAHEAHIIKTAARLEELNAWVSQGLEPWDSLRPIMWYIPVHPLKSFTEGYGCIFKHFSIDPKIVLEKIEPHIQEHETLTFQENRLYFARC